MLTLLQIINRMMCLEYGKDEIEDNLTLLYEGEISLAELFESLDLEMPKQIFIDRLYDVLPKRNSAIAVMFLRHEDSEEDFAIQGDE